MKCTYPIAAIAILLSTFFKIAGPAGPAATGKRTEDDYLLTDITKKGGIYRLIS